MLPSENYAPNGATQECLLSSLVTDVNALYSDGFEARLTNIHVVYLTLELFELYGIECLYIWSPCRSAGRVQQPTFICNILEPKEIGHGYDRLFDYRQDLQALVFVIDVTAEKPGSRDDIYL